MTKILLSAPIKQKPKILEEFFKSIEKINKENIELDYAFVEDNIDINSSAILFKFANRHPNTFIMYGDKPHPPLVVDEYTHHWNYPLTTVVGANKNKIIEYMLEGNWDYIFFVDSDIVIHPNTLQHLLKQDKDIISEIFWSKWKPELPELPQVWLYDLYDMAPRKYLGEQLDVQLMIQRETEWLNMLRQPGVYEVGGLGALTLIKREVFKQGVRFSPIKNLTMWGGDRWFCIRAVVLGFDLFVDTHYPACHIYRDSELGKVEEFWKGVEL